jgi:hypothetical protein
MPRLRFYIRYSCGKVISHLVYRGCIFVPFAPAPFPGGGVDVQASKRYIPTPLPSLRAILSAAIPPARGIVMLMMTLSLRFDDFERPTRFFRGLVSDNFSYSSVYSSRRKHQQEKRP